MRHDNTIIGPLSGHFTLDWTIADVLDHYAVHEALPTGLDLDLLRRVDEALSPGLQWHHQARVEALVRSLVMQVHAEPAKGGIRIARLLNRSGRASSRNASRIPGRAATWVEMSRAEPDEVHPR